MSAQPWIFTDETSTRILPDPNTASFYDMPGLGAAGTPDESESDVVVADFNRDGQLDLMCSRKAPQYTFGQRIAVLFINENGVLADRTARWAREFFLNPSNARDVVACDVNGDNWTDLCVVNTFGEDPILYVNQRENTSTGAWRGFAHVPVWFTTEQGNTSFTQDNGGNFIPGMTTCAVACGDVDGDGYVDLYLANYGTLGFDSKDRLLINQGNGTFVEETSLRLVTNWTTGISTGVEFHDVDGDNDLDYTLTRALGGYDVGYNDGTGHFNVRSGIPGAFGHYMHTMVDLNGDGLVDSYAVGDQDDLSSINLGPGAGGTVSWGPAVAPVSVEAQLLGGNAHRAFIDGDFGADVGVADLDTISSSYPSSCNDGHRLVLLRNRYIANHLAHLYDPNDMNPQPWNVDGTWDFALFDVDGDGDTDLVVLSCTGVSVWIQQ